jgi:rod shape-determining protein MreB and related proteins
MGRARRLRLMRPRALLCTPSDASGNERATLVEAARRAGASVLAVSPEPLAAALGAGLNPESPYASMVVDIGSGVTDIAVICTGRIIHAAAVRTACGDLQSAVARAVAMRHEVWLHPYESERLMREAGVQAGIGPASSRPALGTGPDGLQATAVVGEDEIHGAMTPIVETIVTQIDKVLRDLPALLTSPRMLYHFLI